jgi:hypothetical protein
LLVAVIKEATELKKSACKGVVIGCYIKHISKKNEMNEFRNEEGLCMDHLSIYTLKETEKVRAGKSCRPVSLSLCTFELNLDNKACKLIN